MSQIRRRILYNDTSFVENPDYFKIECEIYETNSLLRIGMFINNNRVPDIIVDEVKVLLSTVHDYCLDLTVGKHTIYYKADISQMQTYSGTYMEYPCFDSQSGYASLGKITYFRIPYNYDYKLGNQRYWSSNQHIDIIENMSPTPQPLAGYSNGSAAPTWDAYYVPIGVKQLWVDIGSGVVYNRRNKVFEKEFKYKITLI